MHAEELAAGQYGVISRQQATDIMSPSAVDRRLEAGRWAVEFPGVYRIIGAPRTTQQRAMATALWAGEGAAISHLSGASLLHLDPMPEPPIVDVTVARTTGLGAAGVMVHRQQLTRADRVLVDGIPCTSPTRTLIDCASLVDGETLETAFELARRLGLTSIGAIEKRIGPGRPSTKLMRDVLRHAALRPKESKLEVKLARLLRASSLPQPEPQIEIAGYRVDYLWPRFHSICECDGFAWHGNRLQWKRDRRRIASIEAAGYRVTHVTWDDVTKFASQTLERIALTLRQAS